MAELIDHSKDVRRQIQAWLTHGLNAANDSFLDDARSGAPVGETHELRDGIGVVREATQNELTAVGASRAPYSKIVNRGTAHTEAKPFWTAAWLRLKSRYGSFFK